MFYFCLFFVLFVHGLALVGDLRRRRPLISSSFRASRAGNSLVVVSSIAICIAWPLPSDLLETPRGFKWKLFWAIYVGQFVVFGAFAIVCVIYLVLLGMLPRLLLSSLSLRSRKRVVCRWWFFVCSRVFFFFVLLCGTARKRTHTTLFAPPPFSPCLRAVRVLRVHAPTSEAAMTLYQKYVMISVAWTALIVIQGIGLFLVNNITQNFFVNAYGAVRSFLVFLGGLGGVITATSVVRAGDTYLLLFFFPLFRRPL